MDQRILQKFLMSLVVITTLTSAMSLERRGRHIGTGASSSHHSQWTNSSRHKDSLSSERKATTDSGKRISQMPFGDKMSAERDKDDTLWDDGILMSSAGNGKERKSTGDDDDEKKSLSQQVKEGKYGLIQSELYSKEPKRPGIISYLPNSEVPKDTAKNLGGLDKDEIWMAENHILVLRGGSFPKEEAENRDSETQWPPIDDYEAPRRQVKIPKDPKVPPPFPIQLADGGSIQLIGGNRTGSQDNGTMDYEYLSASRGFLPGEGPFFSIPSGDSIPSSDFFNNSRVSEKKGKSDPPLDSPIPFFPSLPPGAVFVPAPTNMSDYDEDDQSIFYPPPYSFVFPQDNTTAIPPGPLVPGIILPPPPDFFSSLDEKKPTIKSKPSRPTTTPPSKSRSSYFTSRKTGTKLYKTTTATTQSPIKIGTLPSKPVSKIKLKNVTQKPYFLEVTTPATTPRSDNFKTALENTIETSTEKSPWTSVVSSKSIPLTAYYSTKIPSSVEQPVEATPATINTIITTKHSGRIPSKASYYFYEEATEEPLTVNHPYYRTTTVLPFLKSEAPFKSEINPPFKSEVNTQFKTEVNQPYKSEINQPFKTQTNPPLKSETNPQFKSETHPHFKSEILPPEQEGKDYYNIELLPSRPIQKAKTFYPEESTEKSHNKADRKPKPIYQYSFEATGYFKRDKQKQKELGSFNEFQDIQSVSDQYDYDGTDALHEQQIRTERIPSDRSPSDRIPPSSSDRSPLTPSDRSPLIPSDRSPLIPSDRIPLTQSERIPSDRLPLNPSDRIPSSPLERIPLERIPTHRIPYKTQSFFHTTISPFSDSTMDPHQAYFTKQDEQLLDDVTKEYFTAFGKKLTSRAQSTTPIYGKSSTVTEKPKYKTYVPNHFDFRQHKASKVTVHYGHQPQGRYTLKPENIINYNHQLSPVNSQDEQKTVSLKNDIVVNHRNPLPPIDPDSEFINSPTVSQKYQEFIPVENQVRGYRPENDQKPVSLKNDIIVNYRNRQPPINPDSEFINSPTVSQKYQEFVPLEDQERDYRTESERKPVSLKNDIIVNYRNRQPPINPDSEFINPPRVSQKYQEFVPLENQERDYRTESGQKPVSLKNDILVNYRKRLPVNPDSEFVDSPSVSQEFLDFIPVENQVRDYRPQAIRAQPSYAPIRNYGGQVIQKIRGQSEFLPMSNWNKYPRPVSLQGDTEVNNRNPRPAINPDAEFIQPVQSSDTVKANSYIAYSLPGDVGHVYFLTPQANPPRQEDRENNAYAKPRTSRFLRRRRGPGSND